MESMKKMCGCKFTWVLLVLAVVALIVVSFLYVNKSSTVEYDYTIEETVYNIEDEEDELEEYLNKDIDDVIEELESYDL